MLPAICFNFNQSKILSSRNGLYQFKILLFGKELTHYQTTNFRLFQTKSLQMTISNLTKKWKKVIQTGRKRACYEQFLLFPQCFLKRLVSQRRQKVLLCGNGLKLIEISNMIVLIITANSSRAVRLELH